MNPKRKKRLAMVLLIILGVGTATTLVLMGLGEGMNVFMTPSDVIEGKVPKDHNFRLGGMVVKGSVRRVKDEGLTVSFAIGDGNEQVKVDYTGILPDLFREGQGVITTGKLDKNNIFKAEKVLAKHDENYMSPETAYAMEQAKLKKMQRQADNKGIKP